MAQDIGSISVGTLGGTDFLGLFERATLSQAPDRVDYSRPARRAPQRKTAKLGLQIEIDLMSFVGGEPVMHTDLTALSYGGVDVLDLLESLTFNVQNTRVEEHGTGKFFRRPWLSGRDYTGTLQIGVPANYGVVVPFAVDMAAGVADEAKRRKVLSMTLGGTAIELPTVMASVGAPFERYGLQIRDIGFEGNDPGTGAYPTNPTGTSTFLEWLLNAPNTTREIVFTSHASQGETYTANVKPISGTFSVNDGALVPISFVLESYGTYTVVAT